MTESKLGGRALVADDHPLTQEGLALAARAAMPGVSVVPVASAREGSEAAQRGAFAGAVRAADQRLVGERPPQHHVDDRLIRHRERNVEINAIAASGADPAHLHADVATVATLKQPQNNLLRWTR